MVDLRENFPLGDPSQTKVFAFYMPCDISKVAIF